MTVGKIFLFFTFKFYGARTSNLFNVFSPPEIQITGALCEIFLFVSVRFSCSSLPPVHRWGNHCPVNHKSRSGEKGRTSLKREMKLGKFNDRLRWEKRENVLESIYSTSIRQQQPEVLKERF